MDEKVFLQLAFVDEPLLAYVACKWFFSRVQEQMLVECILTEKFLVAHIA